MRIHGYCFRNKEKKIKLFNSERRKPSPAGWASAQRRRHNEAYYATLSV
jgi:hypothetical protein